MNQPFNKQHFAACLPFLAVSLAAAGAAADESWRAPLDSVLKTHCVSCHQGAEPAGQLDLERLGDDLGDPEVARRWVLVHDRVAAGQMPPADAEQPTSTQRSGFVAALSRELTTASSARGDVVLRRLNRVEYENTVRDLFGVAVSVQEILPADNPTGGFDNVGEGLAVSAEAAQAYLRAADAVLDAVLGPDQAPKRIRHETNLLDQKTHDGKPALASQYGKMFRRTADGLVIFQSNYCPTNLVNFARLRAPEGTYRVTIRARAVQSDKPVTLRVYGGDTIVGRRENHVAGYFDVPPEWTTIEFEDKLVEPNGTFQPKCYGTRDTRKDADTYPEPGIEIGDITVEGPLEPWPPASRMQLLGATRPEVATLEDAKAILNRVLPLAFRRPKTDVDAAPFEAMMAAAMADGRPFLDTLRLGLKAVLCSPGFLYLDEPGVERLSPWAKASRLSYFLWSSMPDEPLRKLAASGELDDPAELREQVERMLADPRAKAFTKNFVGQWLNLREIDFTSPDMNLYPEFDELLRISMVEETEQFFEEVLRENLSVAAFIDSDFVMINERLAKHYGIPDVVGQKIRRVPLPAGHVRGGVLTQAAVLKVTANGTNTSPVLRGVWVLEKVLGETPPPPPSNVAAVEPDIRGATTLREQLAKHRDVESCAMCHDRIDPAGFALENFDVIGGWRDRYRTLGEGVRPEFSQHPITFAWIRYRLGLPVDASGQTPDQRQFADIREFKRLLLDRRDDVARGLTRQLATYALGRRLGFSDRPAVDQMVRRAAADDYGFRSLVLTVVQSDLFNQP
ncbi:MAG: DUF1592 domain-containing protein [Planctomycetales bacterium]|nr:DUF1592 domain-containing protein [Planctomycetales bacterium]